MTLKLELKEIVFNQNNNQMKSNAFLFLPPIPQPPTASIHAVAIFAHGYTSHKGSILNWGTRCAESGIPTIVFDLPGHYLGSFNSLPNFEIFQNHGHELFAKAFEHFNELENQSQTNIQLNKEKEMTVVLGGHSLGALLALKALSIPPFRTMKKLAIGVGLGMSFSDDLERTHIFETEFYRKTLELRSQLVDPHLRPENVFPWIKKEKEHLQLEGEKICLITGEDDVVAPPKQTEALAMHLRGQNNEVTLMTPKRLSHHQPEQAAGWIHQYLKDQKIIPIIS